MNAPLNSDVGVPLYRQIFVILRNKIRSGELKPGDRVMSEQEICSIYSVSRITAQRALNELADAGLVDRRRGRGTLVRKLPDAAAPMAGSLDGLMENVGRIGRSTAVKSLAFGTVPASTEAAEALGVRQGEEVVHSRRVRLFGDQPMSYLMAWIPTDIASRLPEQHNSDVPLLLAIEAAGVRVAGARQTISASVADAEVAGALSVSAGSPLIDVHRVVTDDTGRVVEYIRILYRPDIYRFEMEMQRVDSQSGRRWSSQERGGLTGADPTAE